MRWALFRSQVYNQEIRRVLGVGLCPELAIAIGGHWTWICIRWAVVMVLMRISLDLIAENSLQIVSLGNEYIQIS